MKTLAVIGAGEGAMPILERARALDYVRTLVFGLADSIGRTLADEFVELDIHEIDKIVEACRERNVEGIIASSETTTEITAIVANRLGLPGNDITGGFAARNKYIMRSRVAKLKTVKQPRFSLYEEGAVYDYPVVVKALDNCAKRGISIAYGNEDIADAVAYARKYSSNGQALVEEYIEGGTEYSVECLAGCGLHEVIQITEYESYGPPHFSETAHHQPAALTPAMRAKVVEAVCDVLKVLGINYGMAHMEIKIVDGDVYFIEVGARAAGGHIADTLVLNSTDFDYFKAAIDCCLGQYEHKDVHDVACSGIYFRCSKNAYLKPLFEQAKTASWCVSYLANTEGFPVTNNGYDTVNTGHIAYRSDHKITIDDCQS
ncbi:MAG: ATP-grasp domain-containing protein [Prevotella sp.]|nr:ATP-grasp domain-containing protein [Prevotella sp.]